MLAVQRFGGALNLKILTHLGLPQSPPPFSPARRPEQAELGERGDEQRSAGRFSRVWLTASGEIRGPPVEERGDLPGRDNAAEPNERVTRTISRLIDEMLDDLARLTASAWHPG